MSEAATEKDPATYGPTEVDDLIKSAQKMARQPDTPLHATIPGRIAYVVSHGQSYASNGYAVRTQGIARALNEHGLEVLCFVRPGRPWELDGPDVDSETTLDGVRYIHTRWPADAAPANEEDRLQASVERLIELFRVYRPAAVLAASNYIVGLPAWIAARRLGLPFYNEVRGFWELSRAAREPGYEHTTEFRQQSERDAFVARQAAKVFTLNQPMADELVRRGVQSERIAIVPNGVGELPERESPDPALKKRLGIEDDDKVIGYIGSFSAYEGLDVLLEACAQLVRQGEKLKLLLVGDAQPLTSKHTSAASDVHAAGTENSTKIPWVIQAGWVPHDQVAEYYALLDVVVIPRIRLPVCELVPPLKAAEALAHGNRLVVSSVAPILEYADRYEGVVRFEAGNPKRLAHAVHNALKLPLPRRSAELLFSVHTAPMMSVLKEGGSAPVAGQAPDTVGARASNHSTTSPSKDDVPCQNLEKAPKDFKAISIMDDISEECWKYEFRSFRIDRNKYRQQVDNSTATFAFLESCWKGNRGAWEYAFTSPGLQHPNAQALLDLIQRLKDKNMPIVFWNKEDPMHYDKYLPIARHADIIFTTDSNKVSDYLRDVPEANVYAVPFAAQQRICNPSGRFRREPETVCFAGSYYSVGHDERKRQMHALLPSIIEYEGAIYDRFSKLGNERYQFPKRFQPFIRDAVPFEEVVDIYKRFKVFLNVNTIVDSPTMMSRRVYELLACGTPVVSTPSKAIEEQFPGIVHMADDATEANRIIEKLLNDDYYWERTSHVGYREVMCKHTYTHRLTSIKKALGYEPDEESPLVSIITCTRRPGMINRIVENLTRQTHPNCEVILVLQGFSDVQKSDLLARLESTPSNLVRTKAIVNDSEEVSLGDRFNHAVTHANGRYIAKMDDDDFYFAHYLADMLIPFTFGNYGMVGKKELYMYLTGARKVIKRFPGMKHREVDFVAGPTFVIRKSVFDEITFDSRNTGEDSAFVENVRRAGYKIYAADPFNFIQYRSNPNNHTWGISDEDILDGKQTQVVADGFDTAFVSI